MMYRPVNALLKRPVVPDALKQACILRVTATYTHVRICTCTHIRAHIYIHTYTHTTHMHTHARTHAHTHAHSLTHTHTIMYTHVLCQVTAIDNGLFSNVIQYLEPVRDFRLAV